MGASLAAVACASKGSPDRAKSSFLGGDHFADSRNEGGEPDRDERLED